MSIASKIRRRYPLMLITEAEIKVGQTWVIEIVAILKSKLQIFWSMLLIETIL